MNEPVSRVIKRDAVRLGSSARADSAGAVPPGAGAAAKGEAQVRLVDLQADGAILEFRCPCGTVTLIRCEWATDPAGSAPQAVQA
jgi:hypothetical protein